MTPTLTWSMLALIGFCIVVETGRELCFKRATHGESFVGSLTNPFVVAGIALWVVELVSWTNVLTQVPLSIAFPLSALNYVAILFGGAWLLGEKISGRHILGSVLIAAGVALVGASEM